MLAQIVGRLEDQVERLLQRQRALQRECIALRQEREQLLQERAACRQELDRIVAKVDCLLQEAE